MRPARLLTCAGPYLAAATILFAIFQNFTEIPLSRLKIARAHAVPLNPTDGSADIRRMAPTRPSNMDQPQQVIAAPESGTDLSSIGQDWAQRQAHLITGGAEQRLLDDVNKRMTRMMRFDPVEGEPWPEASEGENPKPRGPASVGGSESESSDSERSGMKPSYMRFTALNRVEVGLANKTSVSCSVQGANLRWDLKRPINERFDVNLRHESSGAKSSLNLNYSW